MKAFEVSKASIQREEFDHEPTLESSPRQPDVFQSHERPLRPKLPTGVYLPVRFSRPHSPAIRAKTKRAKILAMLRRSNGATITALMNATGWQQHSVRGFMAGIVKKKLGLPLASELTAAGERAYRIKRRRA